MSKYFKIEEMACKGSECKGLNNVGEAGIHPRLFEVLDKMREKLGKPIHINCAYRCPVHNLKENPKAKSTTEQHTKGTAADITWEGFNSNEAVKLAEECGADGIGKYNTFVHVDVRGNKARW